MQMMKNKQKKTYSWELNTITVTLAVIVFPGYSALAIKVAGTSKYNTIYVFE